MPCKRTFVLVLAVIAGCSSLSGLGPLLERLPVELDERMPAALRAVLEDPARFAVLESDLRLDLDAWPSVNSAEALDGCWGAALIGDPDLASFYFLQRFDAANGRFESWLMQDVLGIIIAAGSDGDFSLDASGQLIETSTATRGYGPSIDDFDPETGFGDDSFRWHEESFGPVRTLSFVATREGDRLRLHFGGADRKAVDPGDDLIYRRFDCPVGE